VSTSRRNCSAVASRAPFSVARFASFVDRMTAISASPVTEARAAEQPKRISCASVRVRGEKPCVATCSDSSRFVLPDPFGPTARTIPGSSASSRRS
jgi:hypothetical protein